MLSIEYKELVDFNGPEFVQGRFPEKFFHFGFILRFQGDPGPLGFHAHRVMIDRSLVDQEIDIGAVGRNRQHEFLAHFKLYGHLVFRHLYNKTN